MRVSLWNLVCVFINKICSLILAFPLYLSLFRNSLTSYTYAFYFCFIRICLRWETYDYHNPSFLHFFLSTPSGLALSDNTTLTLTFLSFPPFSSFSLTSAFSFLFALFFTCDIKWRCRQDLVKIHLVLARNGVILKLVTCNLALLMRFWDNDEICLVVIANCTRIIAWILEYCKPIFFRIHEWMWVN